MVVKIGYSPCPNDTFIFGALANGLIETDGIHFQPFLADVEVLNKMAARHELPVTKLSFNAFLPLTQAYSLLDAGSALGRNCGPLLISKETLDSSQLVNEAVAIPGTNTTANFLLDFFLPTAIQKVIMPFDEIEGAVISGRVTAGVIIHENRFTYAERGLQLVRDLGSYWEEQTLQPIPLGGIVAAKSMDAQLAQKVEGLIKRSIEFATQHTEQVMPYIRKYAQEMDDEVMMKHIDLYVNQFSFSLGEEGRSAVQYFFDSAIAMGRISSHDQIFL